MLSKTSILMLVLALNLAPSLADNKICYSDEKYAEDLPEFDLAEVLDTPQRADTEVCEERKTGNLDAVQGLCYTKYHGSVETGCCCENKLEVERELAIRGRNSYSQGYDQCPLTKLRVNLHVEQCPNAKCCDSCGCWGDPHCKSFAENKKTAGTKVYETLISCDVRKRYYDKHENLVKCGWAHEESKEKKKQCNKIEGCEWVGGKNHQFNADGSPCQPVKDDEGNTGLKMKMYKDKNLEVEHEMGERGVIKRSSIMFKKNNGDELETLTLDAEKSSFGFETKAGIRFVPNVETNQLTITDTGVKFNAFGAKFERKLISRENTPEKDMYWTIETGETRMLLTAVGAAYNSALDISPQNADEAEDVFALGGDSFSTRARVQTRNSFTLFSTGSTKDVEGFCTSGTFDDSPAALSVDDCPKIRKLRQIDFDALVLEESCLSILDQYNCANFEYKKGNKVSKENYKFLLEYCANSICDTAFDPNNVLSEYKPPEGTTAQECKDDMLDFGAATTIELYTNTYKKTDTGLANLCNEMTLYYTPKGGDRVTLEESINSFINTGDNPHSFEYTISDMTDVENKLVGLPELIELEIKNCPEDCQNLPKIRMEVELIDACGNLIEWAANPLVEGMSVTTVDGTVIPIDISQYKETDMLP